MDNRDDVAEVMIVGTGRANILLKHGYVLLKVVETTRPLTLANSKVYIEQRAGFVLGRPRNVAVYHDVADGDSNAKKEY